MENPYFKENMKIASRVVLFGAVGLSLLITAIAIISYMTAIEPLTKQEFRSVMESEGILYSVQLEPRDACGEEGIFHRNSTFTGIRNNKEVSGIICHDTFYGTYMVKYFYAN